MRRRLPSALLVLTLAASLVSAASGCDQTPGDPAAAVNAEDFNLTDRAWIELMIPMDEQLLPALELATRRTANAGVRTTAITLATAIRTELAALRRLGDLAQLPEINPHAGHKMPGLIDRDTLTALNSTDAAAFDALYQATLRSNLDQSAQLAASELTNGLQPDTKSLAATIAITRRAHTPTTPSPTRS